MSFSYDINLTTDVDLVRFYIQDNNEDDVFFQDEELKALLKIKKSPIEVAIDCCYTLAALFASVPDESLGPYKVKYADMADRYTRLAEVLRKKSNRVVLPYIGGMSKSDVESKESNTDIIAGAFKRNMMTFNRPSAFTAKRY
ncbi:MAG: hypothetical protein GX995_06365 [Clostridiales bacterium]|nr:hypothetical protein [Clostridiales bacterium]